MWDAGKLDKAQTLYRRALGIRERTLGADHPDTLASVANLASLLYAQGQLEEAAPLFRRVLEAYERTLGAEHPETLAVRQYLARLLQARNPSLRTTTKKKKKSQKPNAPCACGSGKKFKKCGKKGLCNK